MNKKCFKFSLTDFNNINFNKLYLIKIKKK